MTNNLLLGLSLIFCCIFFITGVFIRKYGNKRLSDLFFWLGLISSVGMVIAFTVKI